MYQKKSKKIEQKVNVMKKFENFLDRVREENQDEFSELQDILSRYAQLATKNKELLSVQENYQKQLDEKTKGVIDFKKNMEIQ